MARVSIDDLWLKDADDGTPPSATARRSLANARDPKKARVPEKWRSQRFGEGKRWRCRWFVIKPDGTKQSKTKSFDKLCDAEEFQAALEDDIRRGRYVDPNADQRLFCDVADQWIETKLDVKPSTLGRYERELRVYINPTWGGKTLREITPKELQAWVNKLSKGGYVAELPGKRKPRPLSPSSIRNIVKVVMAAVFEYAITNKWIRENPAKQVNTPKIESKDEDMVFLTVPEVELLAEAATAKGRDVDGLLIRFLAYTGARINEALALQVQDMDFAKRKARIRRTWSDDGNGKMQLGTPKNGEARTIAIPASLIPKLKEQAAGQSRNEFLFRAKRGGYIHDHNWRTRIWYPSVRNAGMEDEGVNIHCLRHTYASIAIASGADVKTLQKQLGHATASITLDVYAGLWPERLNEVADAVDQARLDAIAKDKPDSKGNPSEYDTVA
ncbi:tyrosine-type recombinase/integrase [Bifidobacterium oedipodis]|uniref:Integrase/recombinase n=1 Tax=Bifidobacterium oedipodis TaxID=2675322 RepID=A0A7Y0END0_9BIFI|nr:site-specific integrase [Bifidobacterium sp. DSM 109957]NMM93473.1 Integrase/recombinase [Bifidobacterium sp. DSM 109957]